MLAEDYSTAESAFPSGVLRNIVIPYAGGDNPSASIQWSVQMVQEAAGAGAPERRPFALLMTDIVDSTELTVRLGDAVMADLWVKHDQVARALLAEWRGREIDRSDGFLLLFEAAADAAAFALRYHRALASLPVPLSSRAGLHVGLVGIRENSAEHVALGAKSLEVDGLAKSLAARVMSLAQGGQTILTAEAVRALGPTGHRLQSHGHWRLKGLIDPAELFEVGDASSPFSPPADHPKCYRVVRQRDTWLPLRDVRHALPAERDEFVGRKEVLLDLASRFDHGARLVSLVGTAGCGKTRVATRYAWTWLGDFAGGCWFCDLSQARGVDGIVSAVARGLDVPLGKDDPVVQLGNAIAGHGECLVILDNFEQVARHAEATLGQWLDRAGKARFLVTTREVLGIAGEHAVALPPLPLREAEALFMRRARAAKSGFNLPADDKEAVGKLVGMLDRLPLAIELCAARVRVMPPKLLLSRMNERFRLLSSSGGRQDRQATLRAALDWSWDLLSAAEKLALAQLSVFEGGWSLEAAEAVLDLSAVANAPWVPDVLQSLVDKSLAIAATEHRFTMLVSVQEYAAERLRQEARSEVDVALRHCRHFAELPEDRAVADACADLANLVSACRGAVARGDGQLAVGALKGAWAAWLLRGPYHVALEQAEIVGALPRLTPALRAWAQWIEASARRAVGEIGNAEVLLISALELANAEGDQACRARVLIGLGPDLQQDGRLQQAGEFLTEALAVARTLSDRVLECEARTSLGVVLERTGSMDEARQQYDAALGLARLIRHRRWEGGVLGNLGAWHASHGRLEKARRHLEASLQAAVEVGDRRWEGNALCNLGMLHHMQSRLDAARDSLVSALQVAREIGSERLECMTLGNLGLVEGNGDRTDEALARYGEAIALAKRIGDRRAEGQFLGYLGLLQGQQGRTAEARVHLVEAEALLESLHDPESLAMVLAQRSEVEGLAGYVSLAQAAAHRAVQIANSFGRGS